MGQKVKNGNPLKLFHERFPVQPNGGT